MKIEYHPMPVQGVQNLMYVGALDEALGDTWTAKAPKIALAVAFIGLVYYLGTKKR